MRSPRLIPLAIALFLSFAGSTVALPKRLQSSEQPTVVKAFVPVYPVVALGAKATGAVVVEVKIDAKGVVTSARAISGHRLLHAVSEAAAKRWVFSEDLDPNIERKQHLHFEFMIMPDNTPSADLQPIFMPPYRVEVRSDRTNLIFTHSIDPHSNLKPIKSRRRVRKSS